MRLMRIVVLVSGGGTNLQAIMDKIADGVITNTEIAAVISNKPEAYALERARKSGIAAECISPKSFSTREEFNQALVAGVKAYQPDLVVLAGYLVILPKLLIEAFPMKIINIHPSLIPSFCGVGFYGLHVHEAVLARGNKVTGATVHFVDDGTDTGPILLQKAVMVKQGDTPEGLQRRVMEEAEWNILPEAINAIANNRVVFEENKVWIRE